MMNSPVTVIDSDVGKITISRRYPGKRTGEMHISVEIVHDGIKLRKASTDLKLASSENKFVDKCYRAASLKLKAILYARLANEAREGESLYAQVALLAQSQKIGSKIDQGFAIQAVLNSFVKCESLSARYVRNCKN